MSGGSLGGGGGGCSGKALRSVLPKYISRSENKDRIGAVLLENTFTSIPDIARIIFPFKIIRYIPGNHNTII